MVEVRYDRVVDLLSYLYRETRIPKEELSILNAVYLVEREHLRRYGVQVFYDEYHKTPFGLIPINTALQFENLIERIDSNRNTDNLSKSVLKIADELIKNIKPLTGKSLFTVCTRLPEWKKLKLYEKVNLVEVAGDNGDYFQYWQEEKRAFLRSIKRKMGV